MIAYVNLFFHTKMHAMLVRNTINGFIKCTVGPITPLVSTAIPLLRKMYNRHLQSVKSIIFIFLPLLSFSFCTAFSWPIHILNKPAESASVVVKAGAFFPK